MAYEADIEAVLARRHDNGADFWATPDGRLGVGTPFSTIEALLVLHELGVGPDHEAVRGAIDLLLGGWRDDGRLSVAPSGAIYPCHTTNVVRTLCRFGLADDPRVERSFGHLMESRHDDGGWRCNKFSFGRGPETAFSNPGVTLFALDALRFAERHAADPSLDSAVDTLLDHWTVRRPTGPCQFGIGSLFMQVEHPFLRYNLLSYVYVLSFFEHAQRDPRFHEAFAQLQAKASGEGRLAVERPHRKLAPLEAFAKGVPSRPATARYREILHNVGAV